MKLSDWIGAIGVAILLIAFFMNLSNKLHKDSLLYILLNIIGAGAACLAASMIAFIPFVILEGCWTLVSIGALINVLKKKKG